MNHCRDCNSDYATPGTCNCFAPGGKRSTAPVSVPYVPYMPYMPYTPPYLPHVVPNYPQPWGVVGTITTTPDQGTTWFNGAGKRTS